MPRRAVAIRVRLSPRHGWHGWHHHEHGHGGWHGGGFGRRGLNVALSRIDATPAQERVIVGEIEKLQRTAARARRRACGTRVADLAAAVRDPVLDDAALGAVLGRVDGVDRGGARGRDSTRCATSTAVLDDRQRAIGRRPARPRLVRRVAGAGGPYR